MLIIKFYMRMKRLFVYFKIIVLMLCSVIGVGFVSGAEIYQFFVRFDKYSYLGVFVFFISIFFLILKMMKDKSNNEKLFKLKNLEQNCLNNTFLIKSSIKSKLIFFNLVMISSAMFSGLFNIINKLFFNNYLFVLLIIIIILFVVLFFGISGLQIFDYLVVSLLTFIFCYFCISGFNDSDILNVSKIGVELNFKNLLFSILSAVIYVFMNIVQIQPILNDSEVIYSKKERCLFSFLLSLILSVILFVFVKFLNSNLYLKTNTMPFLKYFCIKGGAFYLIFLFGLFFALISSLLTSLVGVKKQIMKRIESNLLATFGAILLAFLISFIGFTNFISIVYPMIGIINFIIYVFL